MSTTVAITSIMGLFGLMGVLVGGAIYFLQQYLSPKPSFLQERLSVIKTTKKSLLNTLISGAQDAADPLLKMTENRNSPFRKFLDSFTLTQHLKKLFKLADIKMTPERFLVQFALSPFAAAFFIAAFIGKIILCLSGFVVTALAYTFVNLKKGKRMERITRQLPDALNLLTSSLRAGHSFNAALGIVVAELPNPLAGEFSVVVNDINLGISLKESLGKLVNNLDELEDIRMFATAVSIQRESGGNLAEVLEKLGYTIRERFKLKGQIKALTGQSRLTGYVLGCAPAVLLVGLSMFFYDYVSPLYETTLGQQILLVALFLQILGFFVMKKIIDIRV
jgi:tight adherence protein B